MTGKDNIFVFQDKQRLSVQFPSGVDHINRVEEETRKFLEANGLSADIFSVCLVMREALLNAVKHGNRLDPNKSVKYTLRYADDILTIEVEDQGAGFDWQSLQYNRPSEKAEHGRGIFIMRRYFSGLQYHGNGNRLTLSKFSPANRARGDERANQIEALTQAILQQPERIRQSSEEDLFQLIEDLYVRNNRLALQNAELRRAQAWISGRGRKKTTDGEPGGYYRSLFEHHPAGTVTVDQQGRITEYSLAKKGAAGRLPEIGSVMYRDYAAKHKIDMHAELMGCIQSGTSKEFPEMEYEDKIFYIRISPFSGGAVITSMDITSLKQAESKFIRLEAVIDAAAVEVLIFDQKGRVEFANAAFLNNSGLSREAVINMACDDNRLKIVDESLADRIREVVATGSAWSGLFSGSRAARREETAASIFPVKDEDGVVIGSVCVSTTIEGLILPNQKSGVPAG